MKRTKLFSSICMLVLTLACLTFGVYSAVKTTFTASGTITFNAYGVDCLLDVTISGIKADSDTSTNSTTHLSSKTLKLSTFTKTGVTDKYTKIDTTVDMGKLVFDELNANLTDEQRKTITISIALKNYSGFAVQLTGTVGASLPTNLAVTLSDFISAEKSSDGTATAATGNYTITLKANGAIAEQSVNFANLTIEPYKDPYKDYTVAKLSDFTTTSSGTGLTYYSGKATDLIIPKFDGVDCLLGSSGGEVGLFFNGAVKNLVIEDGYTTIGEYAFNSCSTLESVVIPNSVVSFDARFHGCTNLISIKVGSGNTVYDSRNNCNAIIETSTNTLINGCKATIVPDTVVKMAYTAFVSCSDSFFEIKDGAKYLTDTSGKKILYQAENTSITSCTIDENTRLISESAFSGCSSLKSIKIPSGVTSICSSAFSNCSSLTSITIPSSVTSIGDSVFRFCSSLASITLPSGVTSIGIRAFDSCNSLTSITIPSAVTSIGSFAFYACYALAEVYNLSSSITLTKGSINNGYLACYVQDEDAIYTSASTPSRISEENGVKYYTNGSKVVFLCPIDRSATSVSIKQSCTAINTFAFQRCSGLTSITIPSSVTNIETNVFYGCTKLTKAKFENATGWSVATSLSGTYTSITSPTTEMTAANAKLLKTTYCNYYWKRG